VNHCLVVKTSTLDSAWQRPSLYLLKAREPANQTRYYKQDQLSVIPVNKIKFLAGSSTASEMGSRRKPVVSTRKISGGIALRRSARRREKKGLPGLSPGGSPKVFPGGDDKRVAGTAKRSKPLSFGRSACLREPKQRIVLLLKKKKCTEKRNLSRPS